MSLVLGIELVRRDGRRRRPRRKVGVVLDRGLPGRAPRAVRRRGAGDREPQPPEVILPTIAAALEGRGSSHANYRVWRSRRARGSSARSWSASRARRRFLGITGCRSSGSTTWRRTSTPRRWRATSRASPRSRSWHRGAHGPLPIPLHLRFRNVGIHERRRRGRSLRQGGRAPRPPLPGRPKHREGGHGGRPGGARAPRRGLPRSPSIERAVRFLVQRAQDRGALSDRAPGEHQESSTRTACAIWRPRSKRRRSSTSRARRWPRRGTPAPRACWSAAESLVTKGSASACAPSASARGSSCGSPPRALRRQRGHDRRPRPRAPRRGSPRHARAHGVSERRGPEREHGVNSRELRSLLLGVRSGKISPTRRRRSCATPDS